MTPVADRSARHGPARMRRGIRAVTGKGTATQSPATVPERITGELREREKGDKLMTPGRTIGADTAGREGR